MLKKIVRWRFFIVVLLIGSILWFVNNSKKRSREIQKRQDAIINIDNTVDPVILDWLNFSGRIYLNTQFVY